MVDESGRVYNDVGAGLNGDNSDNHWTDNEIGADDRYINTAYQPEIQWEFIYVNAMAAEAFWNTDEAFAKKCLALAEKALVFIEMNPEYRTKIDTWVFCDAQVEFEAWSLLAYKAMYDCTKEERYLQSLKQGLEVVLLLQEKEYRYDQKEIRGYWYKGQDKKSIFKDLRASGIILIALSETRFVLDEDSSLKKACLMTGEGINNPYPHSRFLGLIPGGIMNGYIGGIDDEPYLDMEYQMDWRTTEYWSPHTCFYLWYMSLL